MKRQITALALSFSLVLCAPPPAFAECPDFDDARTAWIVGIGAIVGLALNAGVLFGLSFAAEPDDACLLREGPDCLLADPNGSDLSDMLRVGSLALAGAAVATAAIFFPAICSGSDEDETLTPGQAMQDPVQVEWALNGFRLRF